MDRRSANGPNPDRYGPARALPTAHSLLQYGFEQLQLPAIYAVTLPTNVRSQAVAQRLGLGYRGISTEYYGGMELSLFCLQRENWAQPKPQ